MPAGSRGSSGVSRALPRERLSVAESEMEFYMQGRLHLDYLISRRIKLEDVNEGLAAL